MSYAMGTSIASPTHRIRRIELDEKASDVDQSEATFERGEQRQNPLLRMFMMFM